MIGQDTSRKALDKYRTEGVVPLVRSGRRYISEGVRNAVLRGERQFAYITAIRHRIHRLRYAAPADPYRPIQVDVESIDRLVAIPDDVGLGQIRSGNWNRSDNCESLECEAVYRGLKQRFEEGYDWEETAYYRAAERAFDGGDSKWGYRDIDQFKQVRCAYVDDLFEKIQEEGYRPNAELDHEAPEADVRNSGNSYHSTLEPLVAIGRHGDVFLRSGRHRFTIADILGIDSIPVNVLARHRYWQRIREDVSRMDDQSDLGDDLPVRLDHPDLSDIVPDQLSDRTGS